MSMVHSGQEAVIPTELVARLVENGAARENDAALYNAFVDDGGRKAFRVENWSMPPGVYLTRYHDGWLVGKDADDRYADDLPRYTTSLDDALALTERILPGSRRVAIWRDPFMPKGMWDASIDRSSGRSPVAALALCIALLKATTANSVGMSAANAPTTPPVKTGEG